MHLTYIVSSLLLAQLALTLPASVIDEIKQDELNEAKVKRNQSPASIEENLREPAQMFNQPVAIKRGASGAFTNQQPADALWTDDTESGDSLPPPSSFRQRQQYLERQRPSEPDRFHELQSSLYAAEAAAAAAAAADEYEKAYRYGTAAGAGNNEEALENAILKSEMFGEPAALNGYRYYGGGLEEKKRKRRDTKKMRYKEDSDLSPEDILTLLALYQQQQQQQKPSYRPIWSSNTDGDDAITDFVPSAGSDASDDDAWLDGPVYPHVSAPYRYYYDDKPAWNDDRDKRVVARKKKYDPTRELRYLNGPNKNDFYTLSQLLNSQKADPNVPIYHRYVL